MIYLELFLSFLQVGLFSVGGGYAAMPLIQNQAVEIHQWISMEEFTNLITVSEMTPGPIAVNSATFVGIRVAGILGAVVATAGCILPSFVLVSLLAFVYYRYKSFPLLQRVLRSLRPAVAALITSAGLSMLLQVIFKGTLLDMTNLQWTGVLLLFWAFFLLKRMRWNPIVVMIFCGIGGLILGSFF